MVQWLILALLVFLAQRLLLRDTWFLVGVRRLLVNEKSWMFSLVCLLASGFWLWFCFNVQLLCGSPLLVLLMIDVTVLENPVLSLCVSMFASTNSIAFCIEIVRS